MSIACTFITEIVPTNVHEPNANVWTFCAIWSQFIYIFLHGSLHELLEVASFLLTAEIGLAAGVTTQLPHPLSIDTVAEVAGDILELLKGLRLELHYFILSLRSNTEIEA